MTTAIKHSVGGVEYMCLNNEVLLSCRDMCNLLNRSKNTINEHITNIINDSNLTTPVEVKIIKRIETGNMGIKHYGLDVVTNVVNRVHSKEAKEIKQRLNKFLSSVGEAHPNINCREIFNIVNNSDVEDSMK